MYLNTEGYPLDLVLCTGRALSAVAFVSEDIIAVGDEFCVSFISLTKKSFLSRTRVEEGVTSLAVYSDGRIAISGRHGLCGIISPPESVREECIANLYSPFSIIAQNTTPLRAAWVAIQDNQITFADGCKNFITSKNCTASLEEWCVAHDMLMEAVKRGDISGSRHYDGAIAHWHSELYQHCATLAVGKKSIGFMKSVFKQAETRVSLRKAKSRV